MESREPKFSPAYHFHFVWLPQLLFLNWFAYFHSHRFAWVGTRELRQMISITKYYCVWAGVRCVYAAPEWSLPAKKPVRVPAHSFSLGCFTIIISKYCYRCGAWERALRVRTQSSLINSSFCPAWEAEVTLARTRTHLNARRSQPARGQGRICHTCKYSKL